MIQILYAFTILAVLLIIAIEINHNLSSEMDQHWRDHERWDNERRNWHRERERWKKERESEEERRRRQRDKEDEWLRHSDERLQYRRTGMYWNAPNPEQHCAFYGARKSNPFQSPVEALGDLHILVR